jgi:CheY-like chemotaxis protein
MAVLVLAVDDSAPIREMIASLLTPRGYQVVTIEDGERALETLRRAAEPCIVLLDVVMPGMDGVAVVRAINEDAGLRDAGHQIVLMSSPLRLAARDIPVTADQLSKPFTRQQLLQIVEKLGR